jgi:hypothetical protein
MSAFLLSRRTYAAVARFFREPFGALIVMRAPRLAVIIEGAPRDLRAMFLAHPEEAVTALLRMNQLSVNTRYREDSGVAEQISAAEIAAAANITPTQAAKLLMCIDYQACEHEKWAACGFEPALSALVQLLPKPGDNDIWGDV